MKSIITVFALALSASSFATELRGRILDIDCVISAKGVATRTQSIGKEVSFTETKSITLNNIEAIIPKVVQVSREGVPGANEEYAYSIKHDGRTYILNYDDSKESMFLVKLIGRVCR